LIFEELDEVTREIEARWTRWSKAEYIEALQTSEGEGIERGLKERRYGKFATDQQVATIFSEGTFIAFMRRR
jgi:predicted transcriptional regulator